MSSAGVQSESVGIGDIDEGGQSIVGGESTELLVN